MDERNAHLIALIEALTAGQVHQFEHVVKTAYIAGVGRAELLTAVEIGRLLVDLPEAIVTQAYATIHAWHWLVARRLEHQRSLAPEPLTPPPGAGTAGPGPDSARLSPSRAS